MNFRARICSSFIFAWQFIFRESLANTACIQLNEELLNVQSN